MDSESPSDNPADTPSGSSGFIGLFEHPEGLSTARTLVRLLIHEMEDRRPSSTQPVHQTITNSLNVSRPVSDLNPTMPDSLKKLLTFTEDCIPACGEEEEHSGGEVLVDKSNSLERVDRTHTILSPSNAACSAGKSSSIKRPSSLAQNTSPNHACPPTTSHTNSTSPRSSLIHNNSAAPVDHQSRNQIGTSRPGEGEVQINYSRSENHASDTQHPTGGQTFNSDLRTIDRGLLGFNASAHSKKPSHSSTTDLRHTTNRLIESPHTPLLAPQPPKTSKPYLQYATTMSFPPIASKPSDNSETLKVAEDFVPMNSPSKVTSGKKVTKKSGPRKRKNDVDGESTKILKLDKTGKAKRVPKPKPEKKEKKELAKYQLDHATWMRILEFTPVKFLGTARLICKDFRDTVDQFTSIYVNCRKENYGHDMPPPPPGLTERQYSNLLGSKGCLEPGCTDKNASRTHWSWAKRWCQKCWRSKIEREDRLLKNRGDRFASRTTLMKLLECIPVGMHDSFMKPHDYIDVDEDRPQAAPRLYKYYLKEDVEMIFQRYDDLDPGPYEEDPSMTAEENAAAFTRRQEELAGLDEKRAEFLATEKAKIDAHMVLVQRIEAGVRKRRETNRTPYDENRNARRELFTRRAKEDLPHIDEEFVRGSVAFKAATRIFRDGGTERGWKTLKPKIEKEWETMRGTPDGTVSSNADLQFDGAADMDMNGMVEYNNELQMDIDTSPTPNTHFTHPPHQAGPDRVTRPPFLYGNPARDPRHARALPLPGYSTGQGSMSQRPISSLVGVGSGGLLPGVPTIVQTSSGHAGVTRAASLAFSYHGWQTPYSSIQATSMAPPSTGNLNGPPTTQISISSLLQPTQPTQPPPGPSQSFSR